MKSGTNIEKNDIEQKLKYIELDLNNIPNVLKKYEPLEFRVSKSYEENKYRQYRYLDPKEIQILLSPTNRLNDLDDKYSKASPIYSYLVPETEDSIIKHTTFLNMIKNLNINDIEKIEEEQNQLNKSIPFKVKYPGNYLWQIYYSENTDKYFMLVPTEDSNCSAFFYLLKTQLKKRKSGKIFVPISNVQYSNKYLKRSQFEDIENYLWLFTKDWPLVYEVYDKQDQLSIQIVGETEVYEKIKTSYKIKLSNKEEADSFYKLLKAMFILQTELPHYYNFKTNIDKYGSLEFYYKDSKMEYENLAKFVRDQYIELLDKIEKAELEKDRLQLKLQEIKEKSTNLELEYLSKEKQISTFLECKKTFFGKVKYFFKYSKKTKGKHFEETKQQELEEKIEEDNDTLKKVKKDKIKNIYTIEELVEKYKQYSVQENEISNLVMDINAIKLKNKNLSRKIENAKMYIDEIDKHKKSIFEFWKYSNKDEVAALAEGEEEEINIERKITKVFDYEEDLENLGIKYDKKYRKELSDDEIDSIFITTTNLLDIVNKVKSNNVKPKEIEDGLKQLKEELKDEIAGGREDIDIFGGLIDDSRKLKSMSNKKHREIPRDKFNILDITKASKQLGYKLSIEKIVEKIKSTLEKTQVHDNISIYKIMTKEKLDNKNFNIFNLNPEYEINNILSKKENKFNLYKINLTKQINAVLFTNIIYYNNKNRTLPEGMDLSTNILVDLSELKLEEKNKTEFKVISFEDEKNELSGFDVKDINVFEYDIKE